MNKNDAPLSCSRNIIIIVMKCIFLRRYISSFLLEVFNSPISLFLREINRLGNFLHVNLNPV